MSKNNPSPTNLLGTYPNLCIYYTNMHVYYNNILSSQIIIFQMILHFLRILITPLITSSHGYKEKKICSQICKGLSDKNSLSTCSWD